MKSEDFVYIIKGNPQIVPDYSQRPKDKSFETGKAKLSQTLRDARMERLTNNQAREKYLREPQLLVGTGIHHHLKDEGETCWYRREVIGIEKTWQKWPEKNTVIFDTDSDNH